MAGESISTRQLSKPLCEQASSVQESSITSGGLPAPTGKKQVQSAYRQTRSRGITPTHTPARVVLLPWQPVIDPLSYAAREGILMTEKKQQRRIESDGTVGEKTG